MLLITRIWVISIAIKAAGNSFMLWQKIPSNRAIWQIWHPWTSPNNKLREIQVKHMLACSRMNRTVFCTTYILHARNIWINYVISQQRLKTGCVAHVIHMHIILHFTNRHIYTVHTRLSHLGIKWCHVLLLHFHGSSAWPLTD